MNSILSYIENQLRGYIDDNELREVALWIAEEATSLTRSEIVCKDITFIPNLEIILNRVRSGEPIQYIFGRSYWGGLELEVNSSTLIPRPETWELVSAIRDIIGVSADFTILDIGTGSGCIAIALAKLFPYVRVFGCDISDMAIETAIKNAARNNVDVTFFRCDILGSDAKAVIERHVGNGGVCDMVVSNPPYVRESERESMSVRVLDYEPATALFVSDDDPLLFYRCIAELNLAQRLCFEINEALGEEVVKLLAEHGYVNPRVIEDMFGKSRIVVAGH